MSREKLKIIYYGEGTYNETTQMTDDVFKKPGFFPQRRDHIFHKLTQMGHEVIMNKIPEEVSRLKSFNVKCDPDCIYVTDNPMVAQNLERIDVFDWIDWYTEMTEKEFGIGCKQAQKMKIAEDFVLQNAKYMIAQGEYIASDLQMRGWKSDITVIPNGVDTNRFTSPATLSNLKQPISLVYVGKLTEWYRDIWHFINTVEDMSGAAKLHIYGAGSMLESMKEEYLRHTIIHGPVPFEEVSTVMSQHDIAVFPVDDDSPCVIPEYFTMGLPVIGLAGTHGRLRALIDPSVGFVVQRGGILQAIQILRNEKTYKEFQETCIKKSQLLTWDKMAVAFEEVLCTV